MEQKVVFSKWQRFWKTKMYHFFVWENMFFQQILLVCKMDLQNQMLFFRKLILIFINLHKLAKHYCIYEFYNLFNFQKLQNLKLPFVVDKLKRAYSCIQQIWILVDIHVVVDNVSQLFAAVGAEVWGGGIRESGPIRLILFITPQWARKDQQGRPSSLEAKFLQIDLRKHILHKNVIGHQYTSVGIQESGGAGMNLRR